MDAPTFDEELLDVEHLLQRFAPQDKDLQELEDSTEEVVSQDPAGVETRGHLIHPLPEPPLTRETLVKRSDAHPNILALLLFDRYDRKWLVWDPEALLDEVASVWGDPHPINQGKILAMQAAYTKSGAWDEWHYFMFTCQACNDQIVSTEDYRPPTVLEAGITMQILNVVDDKQAYSEEVLSFLSAVLAHDQWLEKPEEMALVPLPPGRPAFDEAKAEKIRKHPDLFDESMEGHFGLRMHEYDVGMAAMRKRLRDQMAVVRKGVIR